MSRERAINAALDAWIHEGPMREKAPESFTEYQLRVIDRILHAALPHLVPRPERVVKAEALREAAKSVYSEGWSEGLFGPMAFESYLRTRADRIERGES